MLQPGMGVLNTQVALVAIQQEPSQLLDLRRLVGRKVVRCGMGGLEGGGGPIKVGSLSSVSCYWHGGWGWWGGDHGGVGIATRTE